MEGCSISSMHALKEIMSSTGWEAGNPMDLMNDDKMFKADKENVVRVTTNLSEDDSETDNTLGDSITSENLLRHSSGLLNSPPKLSKDYKRFSQELPADQDLSENIQNLPPVKILDANEKLSEIDSEGYRAIWARLMYNDVYSMRRTKHWVRIEEEIDTSNT